jgi:putative endonuclease
LTGVDGERIDAMEMGRLGERIAAAWLRANGCKILYRNFRAPRGGEVDIVARHGKLLLFTEVKTRRVGAKIRGYDAVNKSKQRLIERGANEWLRLLGTRELPWRFDVIEVYLEDGGLPRINRVRDAF